MNVYVDESGDLGWEFAQPFRQGGSSRYLTIASLLVPKTFIVIYAFSLAQIMKVECLNLETLGGK